MTSRPAVTYNANGEVVMHIENGVSLMMRFSPDVAEVIGHQFLNMAAGARKIAAEHASFRDSRDLGPVSHWPHRNGCKGENCKLEEGAYPLCWTAEQVDANSAPPQAFGVNAWIEKDGV